MYDDLLEAEREALARSGRRVNKVALIRALREASGLDLRSAKEVVESFLDRRSGRVAEADASRGPGWIDDLLDAERKATSQADRLLTKALLIKAVREASGLALKPAKDAVEDYLRRRGGAGLPDGSGGGWWWVILVVLALIAAVVVVVSRVVS